MSSPSDALSVDEKMHLIQRNLQETLGEGRLRAILESGRDVDMQALQLAVQPLCSLKVAGN